ncbi:MAG: glycosyltransferase family 2 protein [Anaerolineae bacterium]|nr:glycosyltransferase family 2 protein [Anaerolineae bacterium]
MSVAITLVTWNGASHIGSCLESLTTQRQPAQVVFLVDNASADDTLFIAETYRCRLAVLGTNLVILRNGKNLGFTRAANIGLRQAMSFEPRPDIITLLNQDTLLDSGWLEALQDVFVRRPEAGGVGCKIFYPGRATLQHAGGFLAWPRLTGLHYGHHQPDTPEHNVEREVDFVTGAAIAMRTAALEQVGLLNEIFSPGYYEDVELCMRLKAHGWRIFYCPRAVLEHAESASFSDPLTRLALSQRNRLLFALTYMGDVSFRREFELAEVAFLSSDVHPDERRALSLAYGQAMLMAKRALSAINGCPPTSFETVHAAIDLFARLRHACIDSF